MFSLVPVQSSSAREASTADSKLLFWVSSEYVWGRDLDRGEQERANTCNINNSSAQVSGRWHSLRV